MGVRSQKRKKKLAARRHQQGDGPAARTQNKLSAQIRTAQEQSAKSRRSWGRFGIVIAVAGLLALLWPQVSVMFSPARSAIDQLRGDSVYVEPGATGVDPAELRGVIGTRPIIAMVVNEGGRLDEDRADLCADVANYFGDVIVVVIVGDEWQRGCQGDDVDLNSIESIDALDIRLWVVAYPRLTQFLDGDPTAQVEQLALLYDKLVRTDDLHAQVRTFEAGPTRYALAGVLALAVIIAGITGYVLLRRVVGAQVRRADRRSGWLGKRDELDLQLTEIGLRMVQASPADPGLQTGSTSTPADIAPGYLAALSELEKIEPGTDLTDLTDRIKDLQDSSRSLPIGQK